MRPNGWNNRRESMQLAMIYSAMLVMFGTGSVVNPRSALSPMAVVFGILSLTYWGRFALLSRQ